MLRSTGHANVWPAILPKPLVLGFLGVLRTQGKGFLKPRFQGVYFKGILRGGGFKGFLFGVGSPGNGLELFYL